MLKPNMSFAGYRRFFGNMSREWLHTFMQLLVMDRVAFAINDLPSIDDRPLQKPFVQAREIPSELEDSFAAFAEWRKIMNFMYFDRMSKKAAFPNWSGFGVNPQNGSGTSDGSGDASWYPTGLQHE